MDWQPGQSQRLKIGADHLEVACWGPPPERAMTLLLLHEGLGSVSLWRDFPEALVARTGCGVLAYSRAGYGQSDPVALPRPLDYMSREAEDVLPLVLKRAGLRKTVLIGHSDGASIAAIYAGLCADSALAGLVMIAPHFFTEPSGLAAIADAARAYATTDLRRRLARHHRDPDNAFRGWCDAWRSPQFAAWNIEHVIAPIAVPVLAIQGRDDQYGTLAQIDRLQARLKSPFKALILDDCHHAPQVEQRQQTLAAIGEFVDSIAK